MCPLWDSALRSPAYGAVATHLKRRFQEGGEDPEADVPAPFPASQLRPLVHLRVTTAFGA